MFVSVVLDPGGIDSAKSLAHILDQFGFKKIQRACWEHTAISELQYNNLRRDIDRVTDYYDTVRIYQFPVEGAFAVTELKQKKWRRCLIRQ